MPDEPTMGEILRRLDEVSRQMTEVAREMKEDRATNNATFVRQDVYIAQRQADQSVVADLHGDIRTVRADRQKDDERRRQQNFSLAVLAVTVIASIALTITQIVTR